MNKYIRVLYNYILTNVSNKEDAEDILQESFLSIWSSIKDFKRNSSFKTWIIGITRRKIADYYRKHYKRNEFEYVDFEEMENQIYTNDKSTSIINTIDLEKSISTLKLADKELLYLIFNAELSYGEIESITGIPKGTIKSRVYHIKNKLKPLLDERRVKNE